MFNLFWRFGAVGDTQVLGSNRLNSYSSHHSASAFGKLRSLTQCPLDQHDSVRCLLSTTQLATLRG